jgi:hypothetical protein
MRESSQSCSCPWSIEIRRFITWRVMNLQAFQVWCFKRRIAKIIPISSAKAAS